VPEPRPRTATSRAKSKTTASNQRKKAKGRPAPSKTKPKPKFSAKTSDKHDLYQRSVQDADFEVQFITRVFKKLRNRKPLSIREDFCGTALFCAHWVKSDKQRTASGLDIEPSVLSWGVQPLGEASKRVTLLQQNVLDKAPGAFDVGIAFNFSYWCFQDRPTMVRYFKRMYEALLDDGVFFLDAYGGYESHEPDLEEPRKIDDGFTYIWHQDIVDPINNHVVNHIHFAFKDKTEWRKAFTYDWRLWSLPEIRELLLEAGFSRVTIYWEDADENGEGSGVYRPKKAVVNEAGWIAYILAEK
jgi:SAM-dependent methyltransferase